MSAVSLLPTNLGHPPAELEQALGLQFRNRGLLSQAMTHPSWVNEHSGNPLHSYQRLEFLGDSVARLIVSEALYSRLPRCSEGDLTTRCSIILSQRGMADAARRLRLGDHILLGNGPRLSGARCSQAVLGDVMEALIAAVYLDAGYPAARRFVLNAFSASLDAACRPDWQPGSPKNVLQELLQAAGRPPPLYRVVSAHGPPHRPIFTVAVISDDGVLGQGAGTSKSQAEAAAARSALSDLQICPSAPPDPAGSPAANPSPNLQPKGACMEPLIRNIKDFPSDAPARLISAADHPPLATLAYSIIAPGESSAHHIHEWEHEVYIIAGRGTLLADGVEYPVQAGDAIFIPPMVDHVTRNDGGAGDIRRIEINPVSAASGSARPGGSEPGSGVPPVIRNHADLNADTGHTLLGGRDGCPNYLMLYNGAMAPGAVSHPETGGHTHDWDHTVFILEGSGTLVVSGDAYPVTAGDAVLVPPGQHHQWKNETDAPMLRVTFNDLKSEGHG